MVHNLHIYLVAHLPSCECVLDLHDLNGAINNEDMAALISVSHEHVYKNVESTRPLSSKIEWQCSTHNGKMHSFKDHTTVRKHYLIAKVSIITHFSLFAY